MKKNIINIRWLIILVIITEFHAEFVINLNIVRCCFLRCQNVYFPFSVMSEMKQFSYRYCFYHLFFIIFLQLFANLLFFFAWLFLFPMIKYTRFWFHNKQFHQIEFVNSSWMSEKRHRLLSWNYYWKYRRLLKTTAVIS